MECKKFSTSLVHKTVLLIMQNLSHQNHDFSGRTNRKYLENIQYVPLMLHYCLYTLKVWMVPDYSIKIFLTHLIFRDCAWNFAYLIITYKHHLNHCSAYSRLKQILKYSSWWYHISSKFFKCNLLSSNHVLYSYSIPGVGSGPK